MQGFQGPTALEMREENLAVLRRARAEALKRRKSVQVTELVVADDLVIVPDNPVFVDDPAIVEDRNTVSAARPGRMRGEWLVRLGVASLFVVNAITAVVTPEEFVSIVENNIIAKNFAGSVHLVMVRGAAVADLSIAALLLSRRNDRLTFWLMAAWMATVAATKAMNMLF